MPVGKKKILSPHSCRVLQDLADQDWQLIESRTQRAISELNDVGTVTPHNQFLHLDDGGEEKLEEKIEERIEETSATAQTDAFMTALPNAGDSNSQGKSKQNGQKVTRECMPQPRTRRRTRKRTRRRTRLPTLGSQTRRNLSYLMFRLMKTKTNQWNPMSTRFSFILLL